MPASCTGDAVAEITRLKAEDGGPMEIAGATLAAAAMRAGLIDEYLIVTYPVLVGGGTPVLHGPGPLGEPEPGGDPDVFLRRAPDQVRDQALNTSTSDRRMGLPRTGAASQGSPRQGSRSIPPHGSSRRADSS